MLQKGKYAARLWMWIILHWFLNSNFVGNQSYKQSAVQTLRVMALEIQKDINQDISPTHPAKTFISRSSIGAGAKLCSDI